MRPRPARTVTHVSSEPQQRSARSASILLAASLVLLEAVTLVAFAVLDLADVTSGRIALGVGGSVFFVVYAAGEAVAAVGLLRLARWSRGPVVFAQLVQLGLAWGLREADPSWLSGLLALVALVVLVCLLRPATTRALYGEEQDRDAG